MRVCGLQNVPTKVGFRSARGVTLLGLALISAFACVPMRSQERTTTSSGVVQSSELGRENLSRVAASAADIKAVLLKDTGLLVELKRWVAKDATGHGQIISDGDLTDDAIFDRLEMDTQFRSVATLLVQKYGYLVPKLNPESEAAKEHELLIQERIKWLAQAQEQERATANQKRLAELEKTRACETQSDEHCDASQGAKEEQAPSPNQIQRQQENLD